MKNSSTNEITVIGLTALLILLSGKLSAQSEILGHTYLGTFNGHTYYMSDCPTAWYDALFAAEEMGGYLAAITSQEEDEFLAPYAPVIDCYSIYNSIEYGGLDRVGGAWIGLLTNDNDQDGICGMSSWSNGEPIGYTNWSENYLEPASGYCGPAAIIGYIGGNNLGYCVEYDYHWYTNLYTNATSNYIVEFSQDPGCSNPTKSYVCHNGNTICVNNDAVQAHINHGDYAGPCGPCNSNEMQALPNESTPMEGHSLQPSKVVLSAPLEGHDIDREVKLSDQINIFPSPASSEIQIVLPEVQQHGTLRILALTGQEMHTLPLSNQESIAFDLSAFSAGIYLVDVRTSNGHYQKKFVKL